MKLSDILLLLKGKRAAVGEIRNWKGGSYIKTATGWKPHEKQYSKKYVERKNNAAGKKESDLKHRQSEVARLSGEIQGHKAAVEHHTKQGTKQDERQAKHHAIRAQVKQRRLDKHKEILAERHGVKDEETAQKFFNLPNVKNISDIKNNLKKILNEYSSKQAGVNQANKYLRENRELALELMKEKNIDSQNSLNTYLEKLHPIARQGKGKQRSELLNKYKQQKVESNVNSIIERALKESKDFNTRHGIKDEPELKEEILPEKFQQDKLKAKLKFQAWKADRQEEKPKPTTPQEQPKPKEIDIVELRKDEKGNTRKPFQMNKEEFRAMYRPEVSKTKNGYDVSISQYRSENTYAHPLGNYQNKYHIDKSTAENLLSASGIENEKFKFPYMKKEKEKQILQDYIYKEFFVKNSKHKIMDSVNKGEISKDKASEILLNAGISKDEMPDELIGKPKENVIQSGSRGATIAGQQYSKREVDILNSLDDIINRAKSPVVQDLLKKRQSAKIELPSKELGQPKLEPHENKFMELVKRNRSQADKQAGYPDERRKVEVETGVKIAKEKAVEMTKHMKASFIWDIKKPLLIR